MNQNWFLSTFSFKQKKLNPKLFDIELFTKLIYLLKIIKIIKMNINISKNKNTIYILSYFNK